jgi:amino acid transporter/nucleotide-binding universal stress UspA family protein
MISFVIGGLVSLLAALSLSELATGMPRAGGSYYYVNRSLGSFFGSIVGIGMWAGLMFATAFYMLGFGQYMTFFFGDLPVQYAALVMAALLVGVNYRGVKEASVFQNFIVIALLALIIVFVSFGVFEVDMSTLEPFNPKGWGAVGATAATLYVSFIGFEVIATSAEEIKDPGRNLPLAMIASVVTPMILYVLVMFVSTGILPIPELSTSEIPVADVAAEYLGTWGPLMMVLGAVLATVSSANASILSAARVNFAMGRDKILPNWLNRVHEKFRTPYLAIILTGGVILLMIGIGVGVETLADVASFSYLVTYALVHVGVIVMRRADPPDYEPDFRLPGLAYPVIPFLGLGSTLVVLAQMRPMVLAIGGGLVVLGVLWFLVYSRTRATEVSMVGEAIAHGVKEAPEAEERFRIVVPVANPNTERSLIHLAAACARDHENPEIVAVNVIEVPYQTALAQVEFEKERVRAQQKLLDAASDIAEEFGVGVRTRAIVARKVSDAVMDVVDDENADRLMVGWGGSRRRRDFVFGSNLDEMIQHSPVEVSLVKVRGDTVGDIVTLVGPGPISPLAARQAHEIAKSESETSLTLINVQTDETADPQGEGEALITRVAEQAGLQEDDYEPRVVVDDGDDIRRALLEAVEGYETVCIGASRDAAYKQALFGSIPEQIGDQAEANVIMVNQPYQPRTVLEALLERLGG